MSFLFQLEGSRADTVISPRGGTAAFLEINFKACLKLQNESGQWGYTNNMFIAMNYLFGIIS
jgi:hypothetical protein